MNKKEIEKIIPHRGPMLLVEEASLLSDGSAMGRYTVRGDEWFLQGHFPGNPVVPGVVVCEMMAQACCVLLGGEAEGATPYFTGIDGVKFKNKVLPGDTVESACVITRAKPPFYFAKGKATVKGRLCASGEFSFALIK